MNSLIDFLSLKNLPFRKKMMVIYIICVIIPFVVLSVFYYSVAVNKIEKQNISDLKYTVAGARNNIQNSIDNVIMISDMIYSNKDISRLISSNENDNMLLVANELDERVTSFKVNEFIEDIDIYTQNDVLYRSSVIKKIGTEKEEWLEKFEAAGVSIMPMTCYSKEAGAYVLSLIRTLNENKTSHQRDIMKIDMKMSAMTNALNFGSKTYQLYILDDENKVVSVPKVNYDYSYNEVVDINEKNVFYEELNFPENYKIIGKYNFNVRENIMNKEMLVYVFLISVMFSLATLMILAITNSFVKMLTKLTETTKKIEEEKFELIDINNVGNDEIGILTLGMNSAIKRINELINNIYKEKLKSVEIEKEKQVAEFNALQSQINPHFMFNLFEVIRMKSLKRGDKETANIMKNISLMFRSLIKWGNDLITLDEELMFVNAFLSAQRYNMDDEVEIELDIDDEVKACLIPKMAVQVFVENAFVHGLESIYDKRKFSLSAKTENNMLVIRISDNGEGITDELITTICQKDVKKLKEVSMGIGIKNVISRCNLYFDKEYEILITSEPYENTEITMILPIKKN